MVFKRVCILVHWMKEALAMEGLIGPPGVGKRERERERERERDERERTERGERETRINMRL